MPAIDELFTNFNTILASREMMLNPIATRGDYKQ